MTSLAYHLMDVIVWMAPGYVLNLPSILCRHQSSESQSNAMLIFLKHKLSTYIAPPKTYINLNIIFKDLEDPFSVIFILRRPPEDSLRLGITIFGNLSEDDSWPRPGKCRIRTRRTWWQHSGALPLIHHSHSKYVYIIVWLRGGGGGRLTSFTIEQILSVDVLGHGYYSCPMKIF